MELSVYFKFVLVICVVWLLHASENTGACSTLSSTKKRMCGMQLAAQKESACELQVVSNAAANSCASCVCVCDEREMPWIDCNSLSIVGKYYVFISAIAYCSVLMRKFWIFKNNIIRYIRSVSFISTICMTSGATMPIWEPIKFEKQTSRLCANLVYLHFGNWSQ